MSRDSRKSQFYFSVFDGTVRNGQEYVHPLLVLTGEEYATITFEQLHARLCNALRGEKPRVIGQYLAPDGSIQTFFEDGTSKTDDTEIYSNKRRKERRKLSGLIPGRRSPPKHLTLQSLYPPL
jgi:hypothetical protein